MDTFGGDLTSEQTDVLIQYKDVTGIEDLSICRDNLQRYQWDIEAAIQAHMNICEGRPSLYAMEARPPAVVNDAIAQRVIYSSYDPNRGRSTGFFAFFHNLFQSLFSFTYETFFSVVQFAYRFLGYEKKPELTDPLNDVISFISFFEGKFGKEHPIFYQGTYSQLLNDGKRELRFVYVYLHDESNSKSETFCNQVLSRREITNFFNANNTLFWACSIQTGEGYRVAQTFNCRTYPFVAVILVRNSKMTIVGKFSGLTDHKNFLLSLKQIHADNEAYLARARNERVERTLTQTLRQEQDKAYNESLRADQEKQRAREAKKAQKDAEKARLENQQRDRENLRTNIAIKRQDALRNLPDEPPTHSTTDTIMLLFKLPNGSRIQRLFYYHNTLEDLYNVVLSNPESPANFEITRNYPKRVLRCKLSAGEDPSFKPIETIAQSKLDNREVLFVHDLDA